MVYYSTIIKKYCGSFLFVSLFTLHLSAETSSKKVDSSSPNVFSNYIKLSYGGEAVCVEPDQKLYVGSEWIQARDLLQSKKQLRKLMSYMTVEEVDVRTL